MRFERRPLSEQSMQNGHSGGHRVNNPTSRPSVALVDLLRFGGRFSALRRPIRSIGIWCADAIKEAN